MIVVSSFSVFCTTVQKSKSRILLSQIVEEVELPFSPEEPETFARFEKTGTSFVNEKLHGPELL
jgi:hypothetical protein